MKLFRVVLPFVLALFAMAVYLYTAAPSAVWLDAGRLLAAVYSLGIPNPADTAFVPIAHLFGLLPLSDSYMRRIQILTILLAGATLILVYRLVLRLLEGEKESVFKYLAATGAVFSLAFCYQFWAQAPNIEVFIYVAFLEAVILNLILGAGNFMKRMVGIVTTFGIASGTNPIIMSVMPAALLFMARNRRYFNETKLILLAVFGALIIVLIYMYIPIRAQFHPYVNWHYVRHIDSLYILATGSDLNIYMPELDRVNGFTGSPQVFMTSAMNYFRMLVSSFTVVLLPLMVMGFWWLWRQPKKFSFWILASVVFTNFMFAGLYKSGNQESWFIVSYVVLGVVVGLGYYWLAGKVQKIRDGKYLAMALVLVTLAPLVFGWPILNRRQWHISDDYIYNLYNPVKSPAIIYGSGDNYDSLSYYAYEVLKPKPNVIPLTDNLLFLYGWYRENLRVNTDLVWPAKDPDPNADPTLEYNRYLNEFFALNLPKRNIYITQVALRNKLSVSQDGKGTMKIDPKFQLVPHGLTMQLLPKEASVSPDLKTFDFQLHGGYPAIKPTYLEEVYKGEMRGMTNEYGFSFYSLAEWLFQHNRKEEAETYFKKSQEFSPGNTEMLEGWAALKDPAAASASAKLKPPAGFQAYEDTVRGLSFFYPASWWIEQDGARLRLNEVTDTYKVELFLNSLDKGQTLEDYAAGPNRPKFGTIVNQGPAKIPNVEQALVKSWKDDKVMKLQFFLKQDDQVLEMVVWPSDSKFMREFDTIVGSIKITKASGG